MLASLKTFICPDLYVTVGKIEINIVKTKITAIVFFLLPSSSLRHVCCASYKSRVLREQESLNGYVNWRESPRTANWDVTSGTRR